MDNIKQTKRKKRKRRKKKFSLPNKILPLPNKDKGFQEEWYKGRNLLNFPASWRCVISARPNTGKSTIAKNILLRADPMFEQVIVVHIDPDSLDYADIDGVEILTEIPSVTDPIVNNKNKTLLILDDLEYKFMSKPQLRNLDRLFGYVSSHKNVSCICISQDCYNIPPCVRRMSNIWILGKINNDITSFLTIAQKCGMKKNDFEYVFDKYITGDHDTLWLDRTKNTPAEYRVNGYTILDKKNNYEIVNKKLTL
jgi:hypothetical protein